MCVKGGGGKDVEGGGKGQIRRCKGFCDLAHTLCGGGGGIAIQGHRPFTALTFANTTQAWI